MTYMRSAIVGSIAMAVLFAAPARADDWVIAPLSQNGRVAFATAASGKWVIGRNEQTHRSFRWSKASGAIDIGDLNGDTTYAYAVDDDGRVVGDADVQLGSFLHAFLWSKGSGMVDLGTLGGDNSHANAIDDGVVVGWSDTAEQDTHAFAWTKESGMLDLGTLGGASSEAHAVDDGQVVGAAARADGTLHAFSWTAAGGMVDLGTLGGDSSSAIAVSKGQIVGLSSTALGAQRSFSWTAATGMVDLGTLPGGTSTQVTAVSDGVVVGYATVLTPAPATHAFRWTASSGMVDLGVLPGDLNSHAFDVDAGRVVGDSEAAVGGPRRAFVWTADDGMVDLGSLDEPNSAASAISGDFIAGASWSDDTSQAVVWTRAQSAGGGSSDGCDVVASRDMRGLWSVAIGGLLLAIRRLSLAAAGPRPRKPRAGGR